MSQNSTAHADYSTGVKHMETFAIDLRPLTDCQLAVIVAIVNTQGSDATLITNSDMQKATITTTYAEIARDIAGWLLDYDIGYTYTPDR